MIGPVGVGVAEDVVLTLESTLFEMVEVDGAAAAEIEVPIEFVRIDVDETLVEVAVLLVVTVPLSMYRFSRFPPPQYSILLPAHVIEHPFTVGTELV